MQRNTRHRPLHTVWSNAAYLLRDIAREKKLLLILLLAEGMCTIVVPLFGLYLPKLAVDLVAEGASVDRALSTLGVLVLSMMAVLAVQSMASRAKYMQYNDMRTFYMNQLVVRSFACPYEQMENAEGLNRFQKAMHTVLHGDGSGTSVMLVNLLAMVTSSVSFLLYSGIIATLNPWVVLLLIGLSAVNFIALRAARRYEERRRDEQATLERHMRYIENTIDEPTAGKDVRLYRMANWFLTLWEHLMKDYASLLHKIQTRHALSGVVGALTMALRDGLSYGYLIWLVLQGSLSVGDFVLYFGAIAGFSGWVSQLVSYANAILGASVQMNDMRAFLECADEPEPARPAAPPPLDRPLSIEFRDVSFSYGDGAGEVLRHFSLTIQPGEKLALVGINGAGKTTLVKLLCGLYRPDSGRILVGGVDVAHCRREEVYRLYTAVFQDIAFFPFTLAENVSMAPLGDTDEARVWDCLARAGLDEVVRRYEHGVRQTMLKDFDPAGVVLSGGQQQKLLMARVLYKDAPVMILDEPTAALDPIAESETYERFHALSRGKTALYISHRLASTRFCDHIAFLQDGAVAEYGTHDELMEKNGAYARMFALQSHYYKAENEVARHG